MARKSMLQLACGSVMLLLLGLMYGWSVFVTPLEQEFSWVRSETSLVFTFSMSGFCLGGVLSGFLLKKRPARYVLHLCAACMLVSFALSSFMSSLWHIYISHGVLFGLGVGFGYNAIVGTVAKWFPARPGLCSGLLLTGYGIGGMLMGTFAAMLLSACGIKATFRLFAALYPAVIAAGSFYLRAPTTAEAQALPQRQPALCDVSGCTPGEMVRKSSFWLVFCWALLIVAAGVSVIGQGAPFAAESGATPAVATFAAGLISVCNGLSRLLFGSLFDRLGGRKAMLLDTAVFAASLPVLYAASRLNSVPLVLLGFVLLGTGYGGGPALAASAANHLYGVRHYALNYAILSLHILPASLLGPLLAGNIRMLYGTYAPLFPLLLVLCVPAALLAGRIR